MFDVIIIGGGPAGLSAALWLGRCCRRVLIVDDGAPRNAASRHSHGYLTRDGIPPLELLKLARDDVQQYDVKIIDDCVVNARRIEGNEDKEDERLSFEVETSKGERFRSRKLLLTTGVRDILPTIEGFDRFYGRGIYHCPYCDAWEHTGGRIVAFGSGSTAVGLALGLKTWSSRVTACTHGVPVSPKEKELLEANGIGCREEPIIRFEGSPGEDGMVDRIEFATGPPLECAAVFFNTDKFQRSNLPEMLGCECGENDEIVTDNHQYTKVPGLYLAGDSDGDIQFIVVAAAEGAKAAVHINRELQKEDVIKPGAETPAPLPRQEG